MAEALRATVISTSRETVGEVELPAPLFGAPVRKHLLYETVRMQLANRRVGTAKVKTRGEVSGGGAKPWRQKGTGRARAGSSRSPIWVGGATVHGPQPRDYSYRLPASARREALCSALSAKRRDGRLLVVDRFEIGGGKTKAFVAALAALGAPNALVVVASKDAALQRASRNVPTAKVVDVAGVNVYDLLRYETLVITTDGLDRLRERVTA